MKEVPFGILKYRANEKNTQFLKELKIRLEDDKNFNSMTLKTDELDRLYEILFDYNNEF